MGQFSWLDCVSGEQIIDNKRRDSFVLVPLEFGGGHITEHCYDGYGNFGSEDVYALVARWNRPSECNGDDDHDREIGIDIACYDEDNAALKYPIKITHDESAIYENCQPSPSDPNQGWEVEHEYHFTIEYRVPDTDIYGFYEVICETEEDAAYHFWDFISEEYAGLDIDEELEWRVLWDWTKEI